MYSHMRIQENTFCFKKGNGIETIAIQECPYFRQRYIIIKELIDMDAPMFNEDSKSIITNYNENFSDIICLTNASQLLQNTGCTRIENSFANFINWAMKTI